MATDTNAKPPRVEGPRSFALLLEGLGEGGGSLNEELSEELHGLIQKAQRMSVSLDTKVKAELTLKMKFDVNRGSAEVTYDIVTKEPKRKRAPFPVAVTRGGNLSTQLEIPRAANDPGGPLALAPQPPKDV